MGNIFSEENLRVELYNWSSDEFPKEQALIYTPPTGNRPISVSRLSVNRERVVLRVADILCAQNPLRLRTEVTADRDADGFFTFGEVKVAVHGKSSLINTFYSDRALFTGSCSYFTIVQRGSLFLDPRKKISWEITHVYKVSLISCLFFLVNIECDMVTGLSAKFRGPFKSEGATLVRESLLERSVSMIQREINEEPSKDKIAIAESSIKGRQYVFFQRRNEASGNGFRNFANQCYAQLFGGNGAKNQPCHVDNNGKFYGNGSGGKYKGCNILMQYNEAVKKKNHEAANADEKNNNEAAKKY